jgi:RHS repeat-associated protein
VPSQNFSGAFSKYYYDPLYQLTKVDYPTAVPFSSEMDSWTYDAIGNRLSSTLNGTATNYAYFKNGVGPLNGQRLQTAGTTSYTYDAAGNQATKTGGTTFGYDADNRLTSISGAAAYTYDYQGRRASKTVDGVTTTYVFDGVNLVAETAGGATGYFLNGQSIDEPLALSKSGMIAYFGVDALGSVVVTNDAAGTVTHNAVFDAWGNTRSETGTRAHPFTYTGREVGEANTCFYRARFYEPSTGRFTQEDPLLYVQSASKYAYADSAPTMHLDPHGLATETPDWTPKKPLCCGDGLPKGSPPGFGLSVSSAFMTVCDPSNATRYRGLKKFTSCMLTECPKPYTILCGGPECQPRPTSQGGKAGDMVEEPGAGLGGKPATIRVCPWSNQTPCQQQQTVIHEILHKCGGPASGATHSAIEGFAASNAPCGR